MANEQAIVFIKGSCNFWLSAAPEELPTIAMAIHTLQTEIQHRCFTVEIGRVPRRTELFTQVSSAMPETLPTVTDD